MVCSKKIPKTMRMRSKTVNPGTVLETALEKKKKGETIRNKKARIERKDDNYISCERQPVLPVDLFGMMLEFGKERYLFCPECAQFHMYRDSGWGREGYKCKACRSLETPLSKMDRCAFCGGADRGQNLKTMDVIAIESDPSDPEGRVFNADTVALDPLMHYQTLHFCQTDANSA